MKELTGYSRFEKLIADFSPQYFKPFYEAKLKGEELYPSEKDLEYIIFTEFNEISSSLENIRLTLSFISIIPPKSKKINRSDYLKYHVHVYLQEIYILKERLNEYATIIQRKYSKINKGIDIKEFMKPLFQLIKITFKDITNARSQHVHSERFSDNDLDWLSSTTFLSKFHQEYEIPSKMAYKKASQKWKKTIKNNIEEINKIIDIYFDTIYVIITKQNNLLLPNKTLERNKIGKNEMER